MLPEGPALGAEAEDRRYFCWGRWNVLPRPLSNTQHPSGHVNVLETEHRPGLWCQGQGEGQLPW